jgi:tetratricopeptide (TPR) repeat protein
MKRTLILFALIVLASGAFAQDFKKDKKAAIKAYNSRDLVKAAELIEKAVAYPEAATDADVWFNKGNIYLDIHMLGVNKEKVQVGQTKIELYGILGEPSSSVKTGGSELLTYKDVNITVNINEAGKVDKITELPKENANPGLAVPNALDLAYDAYVKARAIDTKGSLKTDIASKIKVIGGEYFNGGISHFQQNHYDDALNSFDKTIAISNENHIIDTIANYGEALCLEKKAATDKAFLDKAIAKYQYLVDIKMKEVSVYTSLANLYKDKGDLEKGSEIIAKGKEAFPGNTDLVITEANMYISTNNHAKAVNSLMVAKEKEPNNVSVLYAIGVTYDLLKNDTKLSEADRAKYFDEAVKSYKETLDVDPNYFDALFNLGALYFNKGGEIINEANKLPISESAKYDKMIADGNNNLNLALPYLEKCETIQPKDKNTLVSLKEIYARLNMTQKLGEINEKLNSL